MPSIFLNFDAYHLALQADDVDIKAGIQIEADPAEADAATPVALYLTPNAD